MNSLGNKRKIAFYLTLDPQRKKLYGKYFCYSLLKLKNYPELEKEEILMQINKLDPSRIHDVIEGKFYRRNYVTVFGEDNQNLNKFNNESDYANNITQYNPYSQIEKSREIEDLQYHKLNIFKYFATYNNFIAAFSNKIQQEDGMSNSNEEKIDTFIKCLCKIYVGHNIHQRINNEISKKTNLYILKGDYFFSLGYYTVSQIGNPLLIRFYAKIAENFAKSIFNIKNFLGSNNLYLNKISTSTYEKQFLNLLVKKYVGFIYYGCCGIKEIKNSGENHENLKEFSFKYGLLLFLREELAFIKNKTYEYYATVDDMISLFLLYSENKFKDICNDTTENLKLQIQNFSHNKNSLDKYRFFAMNICSDLIELIDTMKSSVSEVEGIKQVEEMKNYLRGICIDVENLTRI